MGFCGLKLSKLFSKQARVILHQHLNKPENNGGENIVKMNEKEKLICVSQTQQAASLQPASRSSGWQRLAGRGGRGVLLVRQFAQCAIMARQIRSRWPEDTDSSLHLELESRKPPPLYPEPRARSRLVLAPVPAILTPASPADRDIAKTDYQTLTLFQDHRYIYSASRYLYNVLQWRHRWDCRPRPLQCSPPLFCTTNLVENLRNNIPISMRQVWASFGTFSNDGASNVNRQTQMRTEEGHVSLLLSAKQTWRSWCCPFVS